MRFLCGAAILLWLTPAAQAQINSPEDLNEYAYQAVQKFKLSWVYETTDAETENKQIGDALTSAQSAATSAEISIASCSNAELTPSDNSVLSKLEAETNTYKTATADEENHYSELQDRYAKSTDYAEQLSLFSELVSAQTRIGMYRIIYSPLQDEVGAAIKGINLGCLSRRFAHPSELSTHASETSDAEKDLFLKQADILDTTFQFIAGVRL